jgi:hypothetical protein
MHIFLREGNYKIRVAKEFNIAMEIEQHENLLQHLGARSWQILVAKERSGGFVTTDVPVCLRWSDGQNHGIYAPGFGVEGTRVIFPISTTLALLGSFEGQENVVEADMFMVGNLNCTVIRMLKSRSTGLSFWAKENWNWPKKMRSLRLLHQPTMVAAQIRGPDIGLLPGGPFARPRYASRANCF